MKKMGLVVLSLSACAGVSTPPAPWASNPLYASAMRARPDTGPSQMASVAKAQDLLYVSDDGANAVYVYTYPAGISAGKLTKLAQPTGLCTDTRADVWVVQSASSSVTEFAHAGTKPIRTLKVGGADSLLSCSVDPTNGDLAVTDRGSSTGGGSIWVYAHAKGIPKNYRDPKVSFAYFDGYDLEGDLFIDGLDANYAFKLAELPNGASAIKDVSLYKSVGYPGGVAWDGKYIAIGDQDYQGQHTSAIYQISISGSHASVKGTTLLTGSCDVLQFALGRTGHNKLGEKNQLVGPDACENDVGFYNYPIGGSATKVLNGLQYPVGATLSLVK
jgi:hypothetical protein